jgi:hypothetical protein
MLNLHAKVEKMNYDIIKARKTAGQVETPDYPGILKIEQGGKHVFPSDEGKDLD